MVAPNALRERDGPNLAPASAIPGDDSDDDDTRPSSSAPPRIAAGSRVNTPVPPEAPETSDPHPATSDTPRTAQLASTRTDSPTSRPTASSSQPRPSSSTQAASSEPRSRPPTGGSRTGNARSNRISGFFGNFKPRNSIPPASERAPSTRPAVATKSTPLAASKPVETPPPSLSPPSLEELGVSLTALTTSLSPSHFSTPPTSGTFMRPHYLLLCHSQGLDVLPLVGPPAPQSYALVRRVPFKTVVVMEERAVLVAIAGRREGVRVYALEEVRKAIEWRMEIEIQREQERVRREEARSRPFPDSKGKTRLPNPGSQVSIVPATLSVPPKAPPVPTSPPLPQIPRTPPPRYSHGSSTLPDIADTPPSLHPEDSIPDLTVTSAPRPPRNRGKSVSSIVQRRMLVGNPRDNEDDEEKAEWMEDDAASDEEALVAAGPSGSAALDERTSAIPPASSGTGQAGRPSDGGDDADDVDVDVDADEGVALVPPALPTSMLSPPVSASGRRARPSSLHLEPLATASGDTLDPPSSIVPTPSSPAPTLYSLQRALSHAPPSPGPSTTPLPPIRQNEVISFAQALLESRLPDRPSPFAELPTASNTAYDPNAEADDTQSDEATRVESPTPVSPASTRERRARRRWSIMDGFSPSPSTADHDQAPSVSSLSRTATSHALPHSSQRHATGPRSAPLPPMNIPPRSSTPTRPPSVPTTPTRPNYGQLHRNASNPGPSAQSSRSPSTAPTRRNLRPLDTNGSASNPSLPASRKSSARRFLPKIITSAFKSSHQGSLRKSQTKERSRRNGDANDNSSGTEEGGGQEKLVGPSGSERNASGTPHAPAPKMEYVKLPGTKGALMIKAVETHKKSFLAILCGDAGEKVELFAGTYRTALGLSRTFILPDSPRNIELQLQGDDLVELFLMFAQNVFGLEPATVRVREVRIGRPERRRRRARGGEDSPHAAGRSADPNVPSQGSREGAPPPEGTTTVVTTVVSVGESNEAANRGSVGRRSFNGPIPASALPASQQPRPSFSGAVNAGASSNVAGAATAPGSRSLSPVTRSQPQATTSSSSAPLDPARPSTPQPDPSSSLTPEELAAKAASLLGPYTTFQQLSFAPRFPLASIADEYIIPPTYDDFVVYQKEWEVPVTPDVEFMENGDHDTQVPEVTTAKPQQSVANVVASWKWVYKDPQGVYQGPWDPDTMQAWLTDGYLPPELPLRREHETEMIPLSQLRATCPYPDRPFHPPPGSEDEVPSSSDLVTASAVRTYPGPEPRIPIPNKLLSPISLLTQPKRFGPPSLFFSTRGGHSTSIIDPRGRSVLKGKIAWTVDEQADEAMLVDEPRLGDVKRVEAFDNKAQRAVLVALRQGGLEAVDMGDALLNPGDESRTSLPLLAATPAMTSRRRNYVWRIGTPLEDVSARNTLSPFGIQPRRETALGGGKKGSMRRITSLRRSETPVGVAGGAQDETIGLTDEDIIFLGRQNDEVYICERNADTFRILKLTVLE